MTPAERLSAAIRSPKHGGPALLPYLTSGFPTMEGFGDLLRSVAEVADAMEIGVPFTDPMADGVTIQDSSRVALENGVNLRWILKTLTENRVDTPLMLMSYTNPLLAYGVDDLCRDAVAAGVCGLIVPDLAFEESELLRGPAEAHGLGLIQLVTPVTPPDRLRMLCEASGGFVYAVTMRGTTGGAALPAEVPDYLDRVRAVSPVPVCAGFGIRGREQVDALRPHADGVIVGSAVIDRLANGQDVIAFLKELVGA